MPFKASSPCCRRPSPIAASRSRWLSPTRLKRRSRQPHWSKPPIRRNPSARRSMRRELETVNQADTPLKQRSPRDHCRRRRQGVCSGSGTRSTRCFTTAPQHQNPIELIATVAEWKEGKLIVHEGTQNAEAIRHGLVVALGLTPDRVEVISPFAGGGFGQKILDADADGAGGRSSAAPGSSRSSWCVPRAQIFHDASFRPASRHRVRLGADRSGKMVAAIHEVDAQTSRHDLFPAAICSSVITSLRDQEFPRARAVRAHRCADAGLYARALRASCLLRDGMLRR